MPEEFRTDGPVSISLTDVLRTETAAPMGL